MSSPLNTADLSYVQYHDKNKIVLKKSLCYYSETTPVCHSPKTCPRFLTKIYIIVFLVYCEI